MAKWHKPKASELVGERKFVPEEQISFEEAFPEIEDVNVEVKETGKMYFKEWDEVTKTYRKQELGEYINCTNHLCYNGGFSIGDILREMIREGQTELKTNKFCKGYESSPKGRRHSSCVNYFEIKVHIEYKKY